MAIFSFSLFLSGVDHLADPPPTPARWQHPVDRLPVPRNGVCPGSFETWVWDTKRDAICVRRA